MALIAVDGQEFPEPVDYRVELEPVGSFERNANGDLVGDLVCVKAKVICSWGLMEDRYFRKMLSAVKPFFVNVTYYDPETGGNKTAVMYTAPKSGRLALKNARETIWKDVACSFVER